MSAIVERRSIAPPHPTSQNGLKPLRLAAAGWFAAALCGQWLFVLYIASVFIAPLLQGDPLAANRAGPITGYVPGDLSGNVMLFSHVIAAALLSFGGMLQLIPEIRRRAPALHRWNGRVFLSLALLGALGGLYLSWVRGSRLSDIGAIGVSVNGALIVLAVAMAWRHIRARRIAEHRRWAIRAFLLVNGVWTFRLGFMAWMLLNQGPRGNTAQLDGPFDLFWSFGCYLLPLAVAELYFRAERGSPTFRRATAGVMAFAAALTALGVFGAWTMMWRPYI